MLEAENEFVPISEANTEHINLAEILPNIVSSDLIQLNINQIDLIRKTAGISSVRGINGSELPTSGFRITTTGLIDGQPAGFPITNKARRFAVRTRNDTVLIVFNSREIGERVNNEWGNYRNEYGWANQLDLCLRFSLLQAVGLRLFQNPLRIDQPFRTLPLLNTPLIRRTPLD